MTENTTTAAHAITEDDLIKQADRVAWTGEDSTTPAGYYAAVAVVLGIVTTYLLEKDSRTVVGRVEHHSRALAYAGGGLKGGQLLPGGADGHGALFAQIAAEHR